MESLVSTEWLAGHLGEPDLLPIDCSWFLPSFKRDPRSEFLKAHLPGARFFDMDGIADQSSELPHMLPSPKEFGSAMEALGIGRDDQIVVYDNSPHHTAARGWFTFRHFGARKVAILDGGFGKWLAEGRLVENGEPQPRKAQFEGTESGDVVAKSQLAGLDFPLLDARGKGRFEGSEPDFRGGVAPGHIPGARNLPSAELYNEDGTFKSIEQLRHLFAASGIDPEQPFVATCGSGVTACSLLFAAHLLGNDRNRLYDGSWSEWGADPATPKALGPA